MLKILILILICSFFLLQPLAFAAIRCPSCQINSCSCTIEDCSSGVLDVYSTPDCSGMPSYEFTFSGSKYPWKPATSGTYYLIAFCDEAIRKTACTSITVKAAEATTTTTKEKTKCPYQCCEGELNYLDKSCSRGMECVDNECVKTGGTNYILYVVVFVVIVVVAVMVYFILSKKKQKGETFASLYRKWG